MSTPPPREPWNELADTIRDMTSRRQLGFGCGTLPEVLHRVIIERPASLEWIHLAVLDDRHMREYPPLTTDGALVPWKDITQGVWALPDEVVAGTIDSAGPEHTADTKFSIVESCI